MLQTFYKHYTDLIWMKMFDYEHFVRFCHKLYKWNEYNVLLWVVFTESGLGVLNSQLAG